MTDIRKVKYLKIDRGRYYYQRRVPDQFRELLGFSKWQMPCGDVSYAKAVQLIVNWGEEHDDLLAKLRTPDGYEAIEAGVLRSEDSAIEQFGGTRLFPIDDGFVSFSEIENPWKIALDALAELERERANLNAPRVDILQLKEKIARAEHSGSPIGVIEVPPYPEYLEMARAHESDEKVSFMFDPQLPRAMSNERYRDRLVDILDLYFPTDSTAPDDPDDRDEYVFAKRRLERKISTVT